MKQFPQEFSLEDNQHVILELEKILRQRGWEIPTNSPLEKASLTILEMIEVRKDKAVHNQAVDCRNNWRQAFSLADVARKILKAQSHPDFNKLLLHLKLLLEQSDLSQFSAISVSASPEEKCTNNKIFELFVAVILFQICSDLQFDNPEMSVGDNPDVIGKFNGKKWASACKVSHSTNPKTFLERVREGVAQIEKADVDRGIVILNLKNLIPHDQIWPAKRSEQTGRWAYGAYLHREAAVTRLRQIFRAFEQEVYALVGSRKAFVDEFSGKKAIPLVLMFYCVVSGHMPKEGVVVPMIVKQMTGIGLPFENLDSEAASFVDLFNDHLHDRQS